MAGGRSYSDRTLKLLWGRAAGRCAVSSCRIELTIEATDHDPIVLIGDVAHIVAASPDGPRADAAIANGRNDYDNLILLCKNCHAQIDGQPGLHTLQSLRAMKAAHEDWVRGRLPERGRPETPWLSLMLAGPTPLDVDAVRAELEATGIGGEPRALRLDPASDGWPLTAESIRREVGALFSEGDPFDWRLAVFPLAPISACVAVGFELTSRPHLRLFQYDRDARSWAWRGGGPLEPLAATLSVLAEAAAGRVAIAVGLSTPIDDSDVIRGDTVGLARLGPGRPSTSWLQSEDQLADLGERFRGLLEEVAVAFPTAIAWDLYVAAPAPAAVKLGQQLNATMIPAVTLHEFDRASTPKYRASIQLGAPPE